MYTQLRVAVSTMIQHANQPVSSIPLSSSNSCRLLPLNVRLRACFARISGDPCNWCGLTRRRSSNLDSIGESNRNNESVLWSLFMIEAKLASYLTLNRGSDENGHRRNTKSFTRAYKVACHAHFNITLRAYQFFPRGSPNQAIDCHWIGYPPSWWQESPFCSSPGNTKSITTPFHEG